MSETLGICDEFEAMLAADGGLRSVRVVQRAGWKRFDALLIREIVESGRVQEVGAKIESLGGRWELAMGGMFVASLPPGSEFDPREWMKCGAFRALG